MAQSFSIGETNPWDVLKTYEISYLLAKMARYDNYLKGISKGGKFDVIVSDYKSFQVIGRESAFHKGLKNLNQMWIVRKG